MKKTSVLAIGAALMHSVHRNDADTSAPAAAPVTTAAPAAGTATAKHHHHHHSTKTADQKAGTKTTPKGAHHHKHADHAMAHHSMHMQSQSGGNGYNPNTGGVSGAGGSTAQ